MQRRSSRTGGGFTTARATAGHRLERAARCLPRLRATVLLGGLPPSASSLLLFSLHLALSGLLGLLAAHLIAGAATVPGWASSLLLTGFHHATQGLIHVLLPTLPPLAVAFLPLPGTLLLSFGFTGIAAFVLLHLLYAAFIGELYLPARRPRLLERAPLLPFDREPLPLG